MLTPVRLRATLSYNPETGVFTWLASGNKRLAGSEAGFRGSNGYVYINLFGTRYPAHRLVWYYVHGCWPEQVIDHINRRRHDNRLANLRDVSQKENTQNRVDSKYNGGVYDDRGRFRALRWEGNKQVHIGSFATYEEADEALDAALDVL